MQKVDFIIVGEEKIHCAGCEQRIGNALRRLSGVQAVQASAQTQQVTVTIDPDQIGPDQVRAKLEQIGYEVASGGSP